MSEPDLVPLNRPPDRDPARSTSREQLAVTLERLAQRVRADDGPERFAAWTYSSDRLILSDSGPAPTETNAELTVVRITWRKP